MSPSRKLLAVALLLGTGCVLFQPAARADEVDRRKLFLKNIKCCAGVMTAGGPASGWVVDVEKRWLVSCQHVVGTRAEVDIVFPIWKDDRLVQDRKYYVGTAPRYKGKIISTDTKRDLALIQLDALPAGLEAMKLAKASGHPGDNLHMIGNPAASGAMWNYTTGTLRAVYQKRFTYKGTQHEVDALIGETQLPGNPGDSGAAVFNDQGEVVGVHSGGTPEGIQLMATYIDVTELRKFIAAPLSGVAKNKTFKDWYDTGVNFYTSGQYDKAIEAYSQAIKLNANDSEAFRLRASAYIRKQMYDKAIEDCNEALKINPSNGFAFNERAVCYGAKGDYKSALADYNEAVRLNPKDVISISGRAYVYNSLKDFDKALEDANTALKINPRDAFSLNERGLAYLQKRQFDNALADFTLALEIDRKMMKIFYNRAVTLAFQKKYKDAIADFNEAIKLDGKYYYSYLERGKCYHFLGQLEKAIADYTETVALSPNNAPAYLFRSWCYRDLRNQEAADADLARAEKIDPDVVKKNK